jgi:HSP20 family molecular chaperone IbpA
MTTRLTLNSPLLLGFEHLERTLDRLSKSSVDGYPPYNIEQVDETGLRITLAVAGFSQETLSIRVEGNQLVIRGTQPEERKPRLFLHRGIAARQFQKSFLLAEGIEVGEATLDNGLLHIELSRPAPELQIRTIKVAKSNTAGDHRAILDVEHDATQVTDNRGDKL